MYLMEFFACFIDFSLTALFIIFHSSNNKPKKKKKLLSHVDPRTLQDENSETVWNELTYFKKQSKNLSVEKYVRNYCNPVIYVHYTHI